MRVRGSGIWLGIVLWALVSAALAARAWLSAETLPLHPSALDALRMASAEWLLRGQGWLQGLPRLDTPLGAPAVGTPLADLPLTGLMALFGLLMPAADAADLAAIIWPLLLLLALMGISAGLLRTLMPGAWLLPALILPLISLVLLASFAPGRTGDATLLLVLIPLLVFALVGARTLAISGALAGLVAATSVALSVGALPVAVLAIVIIAAGWVVRGESGVAALRLFALAFAVGLLGHFLASTPRAAWFVVACDRLSSSHLVAGLLAAATLLTASQIRVRRQAWALRLVALVALGGVAAFLTLSSQRSCFSGWSGGGLPGLEGAIAAGPLLGQVLADPLPTAALVIAPVLGCLACLWLVLADARGRAGWLIVLAFLVLALLLTGVDLRLVGLADALAVVPSAALIARAHAAFARRESVLRGAQVLVLWLAFGGLFHHAGYVLMAPARSDGTVPPIPLLVQPAGSQCLVEESYARLAALPQGRAMAAPPIGAHVLRYTPHDVVAAGDGRSGPGQADAATFFGGSMEAARRIIATRGIDYVVYCRHIPDVPGAGDAPEGAFGPTYRAGGHWTWLVPLTAPDDALQILRVLPVGTVVYAEQEHPAKPVLSPNIADRPSHG
ncbi:hypothetical protein SAMN02983003_1874 [Devosia enhydra]|uniref:4-amino-4-deoxy-L-arabinose transferase n=1 Tax=Devosia enhydra TaxID=665118 RepID=A0A1K2HXB6_9HYPH|nr:hypothetical protein [Devosia enhydra]SFZ84199.1 hypothetical protein SAMN02983003_1874 [Devosia enhydra]